MATEDYVAWKHAEGRLQRVREASGNAKALWREYDEKNQAVAELTEIGFDRSKKIVVLRENSRNIEVLLRPDLCAVKTPEEQEFRQLYMGAWLKVAHCE